MMDKTEKKKGQENPKLAETITFRTTAERKLKLTQDAVELGKPLSAYCEDLICNTDAISEKENPEIQNNQMKKLYVMVEELLERNSQLQGQIKTLTDPQKPVIEIGAKSEKAKTSEEIQNVVEAENVLDEKNKGSLIEKIATVAPLKEKEKFLTRFKKMQEYRMKSGKDKSEEETIYNCINYCINWGAFFDAG